MKIVGIICARMGSSRLRGKMMMDLAGKPVLGRIIERSSRSRFLNDLIVATSINKENDCIEQYCKKEKVACFRGSEEDVLGRLCAALTSRKADVAVEIFGDEPLTDPEIMDHIIKYYLDNADKYDFVSNDLKTTYPPGTELEVYSVRALKDSASRTDNPLVREHGTLYMRQHPQSYRLYNIEAPSELRYPGMSIELDTEEDLRVVRVIYEKLYAANPKFTTLDVINFLKTHPEIGSINKDVQRRWKQYRKETADEI